MKAPLVFCLHGFLGQPSDWQFLLDGEQDIYEYVFVDYTQEESLGGNRDLPTWGAEFNKWVLNFGEDRVRHLVGYSLGGRLALHAVQNNPALWSKAIFVSTHLGLESTEQKEARLRSDKLYAKRVEKDPWEKVVASWNCQFQDRQLEPSREVSVGARRALSSGLVNWSLGSQFDFREAIAALPVSQLWLAGEQDEKYVRILDRLSETTEVKKSVIPASSHRILFEQPEVLKKQIESFLD